MYTINLTEQQLNNLNYFLDKVSYQGLKEVQALQEILMAIQLKQELKQELKEVETDEK